MKILITGANGQLGREIRDLSDGIYHYSNEGVASWYDFAKAIVELAKIDCTVDPIETHEYPTPAKRPFYSVLNKRKVKQIFGLNISYWRDSLRNCLIQIEKEMA